MSSLTNTDYLDIEIDDRIVRIGALTAPTNQDGLIKVKRMILFKHDLPDKGYLETCLKGSEKLYLKNWFNSYKLIYTSTRQKKESMIATSVYCSFADCDQVLLTLEGDVLSSLCIVSNVIFNRGDSIEQKIES